MLSEEEAIERLNRFKTIEVLYGGTFAMTLGQLERLQEAIQIILDMLGEKDKQIDLIIDEFYKKMKISTNCYIQKREGIEQCLNYKNCKDCIKQYFENKVKGE